jgi:protein tyrosine phosphatase (PTP) superfamily phosphohydrolase (DUF442 family)
MHDVRGSKLAQGRQIQTLVGHRPDVTQALQPSRAAGKRRIDRHQANVIPVGAQVIREHLGLHRLAAKNPETRRDHGDVWT